MRAAGGPWYPKVLRAGAWFEQRQPCECGGRHVPGGNYYVSVIDGTGAVLLAAGPFATHQEARWTVDQVREVVLAKFNPEGRAFWYSYGTVAMAADYRVPGKLTGVEGIE